MAKKELIVSKDNQVVVCQQSEAFFLEIRRIIEEARNNAVRSVDYCRVQMYWNIGRRIVEEEQQGKDRAEYGAYIIKNLANNLEPEYGSGFSKRQLELSRQFYRTYPIANTLYSQLERFLIIPNSVYLTLSNSIGLDSRGSNSTILEKEGGKK